MPKMFISIILVLSIVLFSSSSVYAGGLSTRFVEVKLEDMELGKTYSVKEEINRPLVVVNTTEDKTIDIEIEPEAPVEYNLVQGYEPIPDLSWIEIEKSYFENVGPNEYAETDIIITIPEDKKYYGKKYQVYIYSHTASKATFRMGIMSRIFLHIGK